MTNFLKSAFQKVGKNYFKPAFNTAKSVMTATKRFTRDKVTVDQFGNKGSAGQAFRNVVENKTVRSTGRGVLKAGVGAAKVMAGAIKGSYKMARAPYKVVSNMPIGVKRMGLGLGVTAMMGIGIMRGALNESRNIVYDRYMQDMTYSRSMVGQSRVGLSRTTHNALNYGGTSGLSNALSSTRHGRY